MQTCTKMEAVMGYDAKNTTLESIKNYASKSVALFGLERRGIGEKVQLEYN